MRAKWQHIKIYNYFQDKRAKTMHLQDDITIAEKRNTIRHKCEASIDWSYFNQGVYHEAKLLNFSKGGLYLETAADIFGGNNHNYTTGQGSLH